MKREALIALALGAGLVALGFPDVLFGGRTLTTSTVVPSLHPAGLGPEPAPDAARTVADPGASAWAAEPFHRLNARLFRDGHVPHWNPWSACGTPLLADQQSAPFYPLNALLHLLPAWTGWDAFLLARLLIAAAGTILWLRSLGLSRPSALLGAAGFTLSGRLVAYVNDVTLNVDALLPALLWSLERLRGTGRPAALALVTGAILYGGMPEPALFVLVTGGLYTLARRVPLARAAAASLVALLLAAPVILPFLEYLGEASHRHDGPAGLAAKLVRWAVLLVHPRFFAAEGVPPLTVPLDLGLPWVGAALPALALLGLGRGPFPRRLLGGLALFYLLKTFDAPLVREVGRLPILRLCFFPKYLAPVFALAVAALAARGAERTARSRAGAGPRAVALAFPALVVGLWVALFPPGRPVLGAAQATSAPAGPWLAGLGVLAAASVVRRGGAWLPLAAVLLELGLLLPGGRPPRPGALNEPAFVQALRRDGADRPGAGRVLATGGFLMPNWGAASGFEDARILEGLTVRRFGEFIRATIEPGMPVDRWMGTERSAYDAENPWLRFLGVRWLVTPDPPAFPPRLERDAERFTRGRPLGDPVRLLPGDELRLRPALPRRSAWVEVDADEGLEVVAREPDAAAPVLFERVRPDEAWRARTVDLGRWAGQDVLLTFTTGPGPAWDAEGDEAAWAGLRLGDAPLDPSALLELGTTAALREGAFEAREDRLVMRPFAQLETAARVPADRPWLELRLGLLPEARGDGVDFSVLVTPRPREEPLAFGSTRRAPLPARPHVLALRARAPATMRALRFGTDPPLLVPLHEGGPWVHRNEAAGPRASIVHHAVHARDDAEALRRIAEVDPERAVLLPGGGPEERFGAGGAAPGERAVVTRHGPQDALVTAELERAGWLVVAETWYPGWSVTVDGRPAELLRANHAFRAVRLEPGRHEVRFRYTSSGWRAGLLVAGATALALLAAALARRFSARRAGGPDRAPASAPPA